MVLGRLKTFLVRRRERELERLDEEYTAMTSEEREEIEAIRRGGTAGAREMILERAAEHAEEAQEGRPPEYLDPPADVSRAPSDDA